MSARFCGSFSGDASAASSPYLIFKRSDWAEHRADTPMPLAEADLVHLSGLTERLSMAEVRDVYLPLSRLLNLHVMAAQSLRQLRAEFLSGEMHPVPFIIGLAGSVAVGKSTTGRVLQALLSRWPDHPKVSLVPTDGFLLPNAVLESRNIMDRKGFPESYDTVRLLSFLDAIKSGQRAVEAPVYSHFSYDIIPGQIITVDTPDILILEGLNVLQPAKLPKDGRTIPFVSDFFDYSLYLDADPTVIKKWYVERFLELRRTTFRDPGSYFHRYSHLDDKDATVTAEDIWTKINLKNLQENILPTRQRADLILCKTYNHSVEAVYLRNI